MDDPIKIIWKFKNENKKEQYHVCIAVGNKHMSLSGQPNDL